MTERIETPIARILRENTERNLAQSSQANIQLIANRLHRITQLKAEFGFTHNDNSKTYHAKKQSKADGNQFKKARNKLAILTNLISHSHSVINNARSLQNSEC